MVKIALLVILAHVIADFVVQPICLSNLKCKSWWIKECEKNNISFEEHKSDYIVALIMHSLSWSVLILIPIMFMMRGVNEWIILVLFLINSVVHGIVDDLKANMGKITLWTDQFIHLWQMIITFYVSYITSF